MPSSATPPETDVLEHEIRIAAAPETVFAYFTDPARMVRWMGAEATIDPRPGGICRLAFQATLARAESVTAALGVRRASPPEPAPSVMVGKFVEVDPPYWLALTWGWEQEILALPPQSSWVEVSFTPDGDETVVRLVHRRLPAAAVNFHRIGWEHYLERLAVVASGGDPGPDPWQIAV